MYRYIIAALVLFCILLSSALGVFLISPVELISFSYSNEKQIKKHLTLNDKFELLTSTLLHRELVNKRMRSELELCNYRLVKKTLSVEKGIKLEIEDRVPIARLQNGLLLDQHGDKTTPCSMAKRGISSIESDSTFSHDEVVLFVQEVLRNIYYIEKSTLTNYQVELHTTDNREIYYGSLSNFSDKNTIINRLQYNNFRKIDLDDEYFVLFTR
jgi:hypothetical protein